MAKATISIEICPNCSGKHVNKLDWSGYFCMDCDCEIDKNGKLFSITYGGELVDYYVNEFADIN